VPDSTAEPRIGIPAPVNPVGWRTVIPVVLAAVAMQLAAWAALYALFGVAHLGYGFFDLSDVPVTYHKYALRIVRGFVPIRDFFIEYPPLFIPLLIAGGNPTPVDAFTSRFAGLMLGFMLTAGAFTALAGTDGRYARRPYVIAAAFSACALALGPIAVNRFDAAVACVIALALFLCVRGRFGLAGLAIGAGFALKFTPALLLPLALILAPPRRTPRVLAGFAAASLLPFAAILASGGHSVRYLRQLVSYHLYRPLEIESVPATVLWLGRLLSGVRLNLGNASGSQVVLSASAQHIAHYSPLLLSAALLAALALVWRRRHVISGDSALVGLAGVAIVLAGLIGSKVLSPQYMVWLLPATALVMAERKILGGLLLAALVLTQIEFPANYWAFAYHQAPAAVAVVTARNLLLVAAFVLSLWHLWRVPAARCVP
jgi:hypothetical protein